MDSFIHNREVMMQGDPLAMVTYGIGILPLIKNLKTGFPGIIHPWCAADADALGMFSRAEEYFHSLARYVPGQVYYPKPSKIVLIVHQKNINARNVLACIMGLRFAYALVILAV